jgi:hypothetical protein
MTATRRGATVNEPNGSAGGAPGGAPAWRLPVWPDRMNTIFKKPSGKNLKIYIINAYEKLLKPCEKNRRK